MNKGAESITEGNFDANELDAFNWDTPEPVTAPKPKVTKEEIVKDDVDLEPGKVVGEEKPKEEEEDIFKDWDDDQGGNEKPAKTEKETTVKTDEPLSPEEPEGDDSDATFFTTLAKEMKEKGIFANLEIGEEDVIDQEKFFELQDEEVESRASEIVTELVKELGDDPDAAALMKFLKDGGSTREFFRTYAQSPVNSLPEDLDITEPKHAEMVLRHYLATYEDMDEDEINDKLEWYDEKGKTTDMAEKFHKKLVAADEKAKKDLIKSQEDQKKKIKESNDKLRETLQKKLDSVDTIGSFTFSAKEKKELADVVVKPSVKVGEGRYMTQFQAKMQAVMKDPEKLLVLAKLVNNDFDVSDLMKQATTKVVSKTKDKLRESKQNKTLNNRGGTVKSLADLFS